MRLNALKFRKKSAKNTSQPMRDELHNHCLFLIIVDLMYCSNILFLLKAHYEIPVRLSGHFQEL